MMLIRTYIAPSTIQGIGVFSQDFVPKGTLIWSLHEKLDVQMSSQDIAALPTHMQDFVRIYSYPHLERDGYVVVDSDNGRFMNHSGAPNTDFRDFYKGFALDDIQAGEELTCDYGELFPNFSGFGSEMNEIPKPEAFQAETLQSETVLSNTLPFTADAASPYSRRPQSS
ncbi:SET domain protein [Methyloligella halotolerans]|uniref:SET domain protein n=1 Tax=Methyloligella halotolerans TaxID=1177755 RepID=A0A1E2RYK3_9HYPH|nr:SET domain-containing protein [Methyloligella halotolerans]ODA67317.1 SET domain protein [Methyloligella halotolerans]